jgi:hypothetical protein
MDKVGEGNILKVPTGQSPQQLLPVHLQLSVCAVLG